MFGCILASSEYSIVLRIARCNVRKARVESDRYVTTTASKILHGISLYLVSEHVRYLRSSFCAQRQIYRSTLGSWVRRRKLGPSPVVFLATGLYVDWSRGTITNVP